jgi:ABC-type iron transport system FetAB permease component
MRPSVFVLVFMAIWFGGVLLGCLAVMVSWLTQGFSPMLLIPFGMLLFGYGLVTIGFKAESRKSRKFLAELFVEKKTS